MPGFSKEHPGAARGGCRELPQPSQESPPPQPTAGQQVTAVQVAQPGVAETVLMDTAILSQVTVTAASFSGPLPPPAVLQECDKLMPDTAKRLLRMLEEQGNHRQEMQSRELQTRIEDQKAQ